MKKLLLATAFCLLAGPAWAQCTGLFPANTVCGNIGGSPAPPGPVAFSGGGGGTPGGSNTQLQFNNSSAFGGVSGATSNGTAVTFANNDLILGGSSTGVTTFSSANAGASNFTLTFPAQTGTLAIAGGSNTWSPTQTLAMGTISTTSIPAIGYHVTATFNNASGNFGTSSQADPAPFQVDITDTASNSFSAFKINDLTSSVSFSWGKGAGGAFGITSASSTGPGESLFFSISGGFLGGNDFGMKSGVGQTIASGLTATFQVHASESISWGAGDPSTDIGDISLDRSGFYSANPELQVSNLNAAFPSFGPPTGINIFNKTDVAPVGTPVDDEYAQLSWNVVSNVFDINTQHHGTGVARGIALGTNQVSAITISPTQQIVFLDSAAYPAPTTKTANYSQALTDYSLIFNGAGSLTLTLLSAASNPGLILFVRTIAAQPVVSASSNVVPLVGGAAGTPILAGTAGKWAMLQSDGTNWQIMAGN